MLCDWTRKKRGNQLTLYSPGSGHSGVSIVINKGRGTLTIGGWYDGMVGIEGGVIGIRELEELFKEEKKKKWMKQI